MPLFAEITTRTRDAISGVELTLGGALRCWSRLLPVPRQLCRDRAGATQPAANSIAIREYRIMARFNPCRHDDTDVEGYDARSCQP